MPRPTDRRIKKLTSTIDIPQWQQDPLTRKTSTICEVFTGEPLATVPIGTASDVTAAMNIARNAQQEWATRPLSQRAAIMNKFADLVHHRRHDLLDIDQAETGKDRATAIEELCDVMLTARFYAKRAPLWLRPRPIAGGIPGLTKARIVYQPKGVVGIIAPWNYPLSLGVCDGLAAVMAGNAVVCKPDSQTPLSGLACRELMLEAGIPQQLWQIIPGPGSVVGKAIADQADYLMFTGSSATGKSLGSNVGERLVGYSAELGGKNPMIIGPGADLEQAAQIAVRGCFANAGQLCISIERIYVHQDDYAQFCRIFAAKVRQMKLGAGYNFDHHMGCITSKSQLDTIKKHVEDAVAQGAHVLVGGKTRADLGPTFYEPTVLVEVPPSALCYREETFGPVVSVYPVADLEQAVELANDSKYGLNSSIYCATDAEAQTIAPRIRTGMVNINEGYGAAWSSLEGPSGGMGISGTGYRHGKEGLLKYTHAQTIATQHRSLSMNGPTFLPESKRPALLEHLTNMLKWFPNR